MRTRPVALGPGTVRPTMPLLALRRKDSDRTAPLRAPQIGQVTGPEQPQDAATMALSWPRPVAAAPSSRERAPDRFVT